MVQKYNEIIEVHRLTGSNIDYQITILSPSIEEYDIFQQKLINEIQCTNMSSHISLQTIKKKNNLPLNYIGIWYIFNVNYNLETKFKII